MTVDPAKIGGGELCLRLEKWNDGRTPADGEPDEVIERAYDVTPEEAARIIAEAQRQGAE